MYGVVHAVAGDDGRLPLAAQGDRALTWRVAGRRDERDAGQDLDAGRGDVDQVQQAVLPYGFDRVTEHLAAALLHLDAGPIGVLGPGGEVAGAREGRPPTAVGGEAGVPADVVRVEVREEHVVDLLRREAGGGEPVEVRRVELVPGRVGARLAVADARVDQHAQTAHLQREGVHGGAERAVGAGELRCEPGHSGHEVRCRPGEQPGAGLGRQRDFVDAVHDDVADVPGVRGAGGHGASVRAGAEQGEAGTGTGTGTGDSQQEPPEPRAKAKYLP